MLWLLAALGLVILLLAGDALVKGAVNLSLRLGVPAMIVSLTIVAFGTSAPELLIAISAVLEDAPGIAIGNVVGSNTANVLLVLGVPALIVPLQTGQFDTRKSYQLMIAGSVLFIGVALLEPINWVGSLILLAAFIYTLLHSAKLAKHQRRQKIETVATEAKELDEADPDMSWMLIGFYMVLGIIGLPLGANLLVDSATEIARMFHVSDTIIGLTLVAVGTSLPELATTVMAALRRQAEVAIGNVIGSNMFNLLAIIGLTALIGPLPVNQSILTFDIWIMLGASLMLLPFVYMRKDIGRRVGVLFCTLYVAYLVAVVS
ncbi:MAG: calcium/sodium antiporter [Paracoccaceae bacterium]|nr:calcium/sodium antiporter [Paracoccaceae bacterium]MDG1736378.1 calcium/sodium antiporter [Paracoccaceae bacterium]MDG2258864.1 calcium/sodium antiporter [Paracoccaceae bacterium]